MYPGIASFIYVICVNRKTCFLGFMLSDKKDMDSPDLKQFIGQPVKNLPSPCVVVNMTQVRKNCNKMLRKAEDFGLALH